MEAPVADEGVSEGLVEEEEVEVGGEVDAQGLEEVLEVGVGEVVEEGDDDGGAEEGDAVAQVAAVVLEVVDVIIDEDGVAQVEELHQEAEKDQLCELAAKLFQQQLQEGLFR